MFGLLAIVRIWGRVYGTEKDCNLKVKPQYLTSSIIGQNGEIESHGTIMTANGIVTLQIIQGIATKNMIAFITNCNKDA